MTWTACLEAAETYAGRGLRVFPVQAGGKRPLLDSWPDRATTDTATLQGWWRQWPNANLAIATGERSGVVVIDIDVKSGVNGFASLAGVELSGPQVQTPSGGLHYYLAHPGKHTPNKAGVRPGIDIRGDGGYVVAPPSEIEGVAYTWKVGLSTGYGDYVELAPKRERPRRDDSPRRVAEGTTRYGERALEEECSEVERASEGTRNDRLNQAAFAIGQLVAGGEITEDDGARALYSAAVNCGLVADDGERSVWATINSGISAGGKHPRAASNDTRAPLPKPPPPPPKQMVERAKDIYTLGDVWGDFRAELQRRSAGGYAPVLSGIDSLDRLLDGGAPCGAITLLCGPPGTGKTSLATSWGLQQARSGKPVLMWSLEMPAEDIYSRIVTLETSQAWGQVRRGDHVKAVELLEERVSELPFRVIDRSETATVGHLEVELERLANHFGSKPFVVVDYAQQIVRAQSDQGMRRAADESSSALLGLALRHDVAVLALSSVGRGAYNVLSDDNRPQLDRILGMAKDSGQFEFDAAVVMGIALLAPRRDGRRTGWLAVGKNRLGGGIGQVAVEYNGLSGWFNECSEDDIPSTDAVVDDLQQRILETIEQHHCTSRKDIRKFVRGNQNKISKAISNLLEAGLIAKNGKNSAYTRN